MALTPDLDALHHAVTGVVTSMRQQLDEGFEPYPARVWPDEVAELCRAAEQIVWARDAALVLARSVGASWPELAAASGTSDSTLYGRYRRALIREAR